MRIHLKVILFFSRKLILSSGIILDKKVKKSWWSMVFIVFFIVLFEISCLNHQKFYGYFITLIFSSFFFFYLRVHLCWNVCLFFTFLLFSAWLGLQSLVLSTQIPPNQALGNWGRLNMSCWMTRGQLKFLSSVVLILLYKENKLLHARLVTLSLWWSLHVFPKS